MCFNAEQPDNTVSGQEIRCKAVQTGDVLLLSEEQMLEGRFEGVLVCFVLFASPTAWEEPSPLSTRGNQEYNIYHQMAI